MWQGCRKACVWFETPSAAQVVQSKITFKCQPHASSQLRCSYDYIIYLSRYLLRYLTQFTYSFVLFLLHYAILNMAHTPDNSASIYQILRSITESGHQSHALVDYLRGHDGDGTPKPGVEILPLLIPKKNTLCHPCHTFLSTFLRRDFSNSEIWSPLAPNTFCYEAMSVNHDALERSVRLLNCTICRFFSRASAEKLDKTFTPGQPVVWGTWTLQPSMLGHWTAEPFVFYFGSTAYRNLGLACGPPNFAAYLAPSPRHLDREDGLSKLPGLQFRRSGPAGMEYITGLREAPPLTVHSSEVAPMIKRWQEQCLSSHKNCQRLVLSAQQRPKRLVRVSRGEWGVHSVRLVESAVNEPYLALSYAVSLDRPYEHYCKKTSWLKYEFFIAVGQCVTSKNNKRECW